jgi:hypothetical protein
MLWADSIMHGLHSFAGKARLRFSLGAAYAGQCIDFVLRREWAVCVHAE